jgi:hypothetical protein
VQPGRGDISTGVTAEIRTSLFPAMTAMGGKLRFGQARESLNFFSSRGRPFAALIRDDSSEGMDIRCVCAVKRGCC